MQSLAVGKMAKIYIDVVDHNATLLPKLYRLVLRFNRIGKLNRHAVTSRYSALEINVLSEAITSTNAFSTAIVILQFFVLLFERRNCMIRSRIYFRNIENLMLVFKLIQFVLLNGTLLLHNTYLCYFEN